ncbi:MAG: DNA-binding response regulator [Candidatus Electrothrix sp. AR3]|nr:DNA-binding response regulator [Candidatus Electrothrix sp. AR3]
MKKIVLIDDHDTFRAGLRQLISKYTDYEIVGEAADAQQGEATVRKYTPDLAVVDLSLPDKSGIQLTRILKSALPDIRIVIVSMHSKIDYILNALRAGAQGYLVKESVSGCLGEVLHLPVVDLHHDYRALCQVVDLPDF